MPAAATAAAKAAILVVRSRRGRRLLLAFFAGLALSLALVVIVLLSSVSAVIGVCRTEAESTQPQQASAPSGNSESPGLSPNSSESPTFVSQSWSEEALSDIPEDYLPLYEKAAEEYGLDAAILAAIGDIESDHGRGDNDCAANFAGAQGPMQFIGSTWANVGVDGNGDGTSDVCNPEDAIPGAANYLALEGAPQDYHSAILAYNNAEWYYQDVVARAEEYRGAGGGGEDALAASDSPNEASSGLATLLSPLAMREAQAAEASGTVGNPGETDYTPAEIDTLNLINDYREENGLAALQLSDNISKASAHYAHDMAKYDAYRVPEAHVSGPTDYYFEGAVLTDRMNAEGYYGSAYGENIAAGQAGAQEVFTAWRESPGHNEMMLNPDMAVIGIGLVENPETSYEEFWVTNFGSEPDDTTRPVSEAGGGSSGGGPNGGSSGGSGSDVQGNSKAVFPLPDDYFDSYEDTWGAARGGGRGHEGTDMFAPDGTPIYSITAGKVVPVSGSDSEGWNELGGWTTMIEATEDVGPIKAGDTLYYAHQLEPSPVKPGDTVEAGDVIGKVGSTGEGPPGSILPDGRGEHLHLGWYDPTGSRAEAGSGAMNPYSLLEWLRQNGGTATGTGGGVALGAPVSTVPAYCKPLQAMGLVPHSAPTGRPTGEAVPTSMSEEGGSGSGSGDGSGSESGASPGSGSGTGQQVVEEALKYEGTPYVLGGPDVCVPGESMDCTCLTTTVFREFGYELPDMPTEVWSYGEEVTGELQAGDVHVWGDP
ncbi:MAG: CAP domain-containing protein, partial [Rubrobacteraceae bacterium]